MNAHTITQNVLLAVVVLSCWLGVLGMWRMREPTQALHYLSLPATFGVIPLTLTILITQGFTQDFWKMLLIAGVLMVINSVVTHATARAFRARAIGHWEPCAGDPMEFVHDTQEAQS